MHYQVRLDDQASANLRWAYQMEHTQHDLLIIYRSKNVVKGIIGGPFMLSAPDPTAP